MTDSENETSDSGDEGSLVLGEDTGGSGDEWQIVGSSTEPKIGKFMLKLSTRNTFQLEAKQLSY